MNKRQIINKVKEYIEKNFKGEPTGHDRWHTFRVWQMAKKIAQKEGGDLFLIELGALLHDIADWKFYDGDFKVGSKKAENLLKKLKVDEKTIKEVCHIINNVFLREPASRTESKQKKEKLFRMLIDWMLLVPWVLPEHLLMADTKEGKFIILVLNQNCTNPLKHIKTVKPLR